MRFHRVKDRTGQKFVIIIDEWDVIIRDGTITENIQDEYINFLRGMFKGVEPTKYIQLAYLTGILPIKKEKILLQTEYLKLPVVMKQTTAMMQPWRKKLLLVYTV